jgi:DNA ligase-1
MNTDSMQHGFTWSGQDVADWVATEKYDGIRAYWDGSTLWTRGGKVVPIPQEWRDALPAGVHLDGEIFAGYGNRKRAEWFARAGKYADECRYIAFDVPQAEGNYYARMIQAGRHTMPYSMTGPKGGHLQIPRLLKITGIEHAAELVKHGQSVGGEGLILRHPELAYTPGRTDKLLKLKTWEI